MRLRCAASRLGSGKSAPCGESLFEHTVFNRDIIVCDGCFRCAAVCCDGSKAAAEYVGVFAARAAHVVIIDGHVQTCGIRCGEADRGSGGMRDRTALIYNLVPVCLGGKIAARLRGSLLDEGSVEIAVLYALRIDVDRIRVCMVVGGAIARLMNEDSRTVYVAALIRDRHIVIVLRDRLRVCRYAPERQSCSDQCAETPPRISSMDLHKNDSFH